MGQQDRGSKIPEFHEEEQTMSKITCKCCDRQMDGNALVAAPFHQLRDQLGFAPKQSDVIRASVCAERKVGYRFSFEGTEWAVCISCDEILGKEQPGYYPGTDFVKAKFAVETGKLPNRGQYMACVKCWECASAGWLPLNTALRLLHQGQYEQIREQKNAQWEKRNQQRKVLEAGYTAPKQPESMPKASDLLVTEKGKGKGKKGDAGKKARATQQEVATRVLAWSPES
ncbi:MAG: hypothetical protein Q7R79_02255 [bacterium]|nr:hypothetical protein [bacterium]